MWRWLESACSIGKILTSVKAGLRRIRCHWPLQAEECNLRFRLGLRFCLGRSHMVFRRWLSALQEQPNYHLLPHTSHVSFRLFEVVKVMQCCYQAVHMML
jgi:hypothetical protein